MAITGSLDVNGLKVVERDPTGRYARYDEIVGKMDSKTVYKGYDEIEGIEISWSKTFSYELIVINNKGFAMNLISEAELLKSLDHENIVKCYHYWTDDDYINMITEPLTLGNLEDYLNNKGDHFDVEEIREFGRQILKGLHYLHSQDPPIMHRDIHCDHFYFSKKTGRVMIGDLCYAVKLKITHGVVIGPEDRPLYHNQLTDIYSFGLCFLQMLTGEVPYKECRTLNKLWKVKRKYIMPKLVFKVTDYQVRNLIIRCISPASYRPSAIDILNHPLFASNASIQQSRVGKGRSFSTIKKALYKFLFSSVVHPVYPLANPDSGSVLGG